MGFDIQYGPISTALGLANQAGRGKYFQQNFEDSNQFLGTLNSMQQTNDARRATDMQNALGYSEAAARNSLAQQQLAATQAYHQASLGSLNNFRNNTSDYRQGRLGVEQQRADNQSQGLADRQNNTAAINAAGGVGGKWQPPMSQSTPFQALKTQLDTLTRQQQLLEGERKNVSTEEMNPLTKAKTGRVVPRPGQEQAYNQWLAAYSNNQKAQQQAAQQMQQFLQPKTPNPAPAAQVDPRMQQQTAAAASGGLAGRQAPPQVGPDGLLPPGVPPVVLSQPQQQPQPGQSGGQRMTATNPQTGQKLVFDPQSNQWVPLQ